VYKITGALPAAKLQEVIPNGIVVPAGIVKETPVASTTEPLVAIELPYLKAVMVDPVGDDAEPVPKEVIPAKEPVVEFPAVKITPPKFTGIFAMFLFFK
jgi:hypothetical protein